MEKLIKQVEHIARQIARLSKENEITWLAQDIERLCEKLKDKSK